MIIYRSMRRFRHYLIGTLFEANVDRTKFADYYQAAMKEIIALGITPQQMAVLKKYGLLANDNVTGFYEGRSGEGRYQTLIQAIQHVKQTGEQSFYVEMDLQNLGGINAKLGHTGANEVYTQIAGVIKQQLSAIASDSAFFRHGGDEMSAILVDTSAENIERAFQKISQLTLQIAQKYNVHDAPHSKPGGIAGTGIHHGIAQILPQHETNPGLVFREADTKLELNKRNKKNVNGNTPMSPGANAPTQQGQIQRAGNNGQIAAAS